MCLESKHIKVKVSSYSYLTANLINKVKYLLKLLVCKTVKLLKSCTAPLTTSRISWRADNGLAKPVVISVKLPF